MLVEYLYAKIRLKLIEDGLNIRHITIITIITNVYTGMIFINLEIIIKKMFNR